ncbi:MAG: hypothetical protein A3G80_14965 [Betaproteobacteria bacterium RIFCSPLOWO2_12_FULL_62_13b]|nr:MAG: hypothetical protein A3G80_14965 [Betaproteobacteria bacterium RIFCSPLOWO2_12_FULL_62_13b]OGB94987.1 MAG: hypothetical protein A3H39_04605 [candidate division NC10 bacterium RIFCSPLOWO2_02_FULL_66_22]
MADIVLVQPKTEENDIPYAPTALICLAAVAEREFSVRIVDTRLDHDWKQTLLRELETGPLCVGITAMTGGQIHYGLEVARWVKRNAPDIPVVWGGIHPTYYPEQTLRSSYADYVVLNEGEMTLLALVRALKQGRRSLLREIPGIGFKENGLPVVNPREGGFLNLDEMPEPAWHLIDVPRYIEALGVSGQDRPLNINTSRGCPFRCKFCFELSYNDRTWRARRADLVIREVAKLHDMFGFNRLIIHDDLFAVHRQSMARAIEIAKGIHEIASDIRFTITHRVDQYDTQWLTTMRQHGLYQTRAGVESGSPRILKSIAKDITVDQILNSARVSRDLDFEVTYSFVIGWPGEDDADRQQTIDLAFRLLEINPRAWIFPLWIYIPYPGTPHFSEAVAQGFQEPQSLEDWAEYSWGRVQVPWITEVAKFENIHYLSRFALNSKTLRTVVTDLGDEYLKSVIKVRRLGGILLKDWARFRFKHAFWAFPYEYRVLRRLESAIERVVR